MADWKRETFSPPASVSTRGGDILGQFGESDMHTRARLMQMSEMSRTRIIERNLRRAAEAKVSQLQRAAIPQNLVRSSKVVQAVSPKRERTQEERDRVRQSIRQRVAEWRGFRGNAGVKDTGILATAIPLSLESEKESIFSSLSSKKVQSNKVLRGASQLQIIQLDTEAEELASQSGMQYPIASGALFEKNEEDASNSDSSESEWEGLEAVEELSTHSSTTKSWDISKQDGLASTPSQADSSNSFVRTTVEVMLEQRLISLLHSWMPPQFTRPDKALISPICSGLVNSALEMESAFRTRGSENTPPLYGVINLSAVGDSNRIDNILRRSGRLVWPEDSCVIIDVGDISSHIFDGKHVTFLICLLNSGESFWMDENDFPAASSGKVFTKLPRPLPRDFSSVCLIRRASKTRESYRYVIQDTTRILACWCVSFVPRAREEAKVSRQPLKESSSQFGSEKQQYESHALSQLSRWSRLAQNYRGHPNSHHEINDADHEGDDTFPVSSWSDEGEVEKAEARLEKFHLKCKLGKAQLSSNFKVLRSNLESLHKHHENMQDKLKRDLKVTLADIEEEKRKRIAGLRAWKLQLLQYRLAIQRSLSCRKRAFVEIGSMKGFDAYASVFDNVAMTSKQIAEPPGWDPQNPPIESGLSNISIFGLNDATSPLARESSEKQRLGSKSLSYANGELPIRRSPQSSSIRSDEMKDSHRANKAANPKMRAEPVPVKEFTVDRLAGLTRTSSPGAVLEKASWQPFAPVASSQKKPDGQLGRTFSSILPATGNELLGNTKSENASLPPVTAAAMRIEKKRQFPSGNLEAPSIFPSDSQSGSYVSLNHRIEPTAAMDMLGSRPLNPKVLSHEPHTDVKTELDTGKSKYRPRSDVPLAFSGWLNKKGAWKKAWKRRWFKLQPTSLIWKESSSQSSSKKGSVQLARCVVKATVSSPREFSLETPQRIYFLAVDESSEWSREEWIRHLVHNIALTRQHLRSQSGLFVLFGNGSEYALLDRLIRSSGQELLAHIYMNLLDTQHIENAATSLFQIFRFRGLAMAATVTSACLRIELENTSSFETLFRRNSIAARMLDLFIRTAPNEASGAFGAAIEVIDHLDPVLGLIEAEGHKGDKDLHTSSFLKVVCSLCLERMEEALGSLTPLKCAVLVQLCADISSKFRGPDVTRKDIGALIIALLFLRVICPAIIRDRPGFPAAPARVKQGKILVAKVLQKLANNKQFTSTEPQMQEMNSFISRQKGRIQSIFDKIEAQAASISDSGRFITDEEAIFAADKDIETLASSLFHIHGILHAQPATFWRTNESMFPGVVRKNPGFNPQQMLRKTRSLLVNLGPPPRVLEREYGSLAATENNSL